ncbi:hypothetical protein BaRGS_00039442, partial [Batillaria attramentaria]
ELCRTQIASLFSKDNITTERQQARRQSVINLPHLFPAASRHPPESEKCRERAVMSR